MKKLTLLATAILLFTSATQAQLKIGPELGVNFNKLNYDITTDEASNVGFRVGATMDIGLGMFALQPGIFYSMRGGEHDYAVGATRYEDNTNIGYLEVPLLLQYKINAGPGKFFVGLGPTADIAISGKVKSVATDATGNKTKEDSDIEFGSAATEFQRTDIGAMFNIGYELDKGLFIRPFYNLGLTNLSNISGLKVNNATWGLSVGWLFGL